MNTGRLLFAGLFALVMAIGASSTAQARSSYGFSISTGGPVWGAPVYPAPPVVVPVAPVLAPPPPPVVYSYPYVAPAPVGPSISFGFVSH